MIARRSPGDCEGEKLGGCAGADQPQVSVAHVDVPVYERATGAQGSNQAIQPRHGVFVPRVPDDKLESVRSDKRAQSASDAYHFSTCTLPAAAVSVQAIGVPVYGSTFTALGAACSPLVVARQPSLQHSSSCSPVSTATGAAQQASPRHASMPSLIAKPAITSAATESAHAHPSRLLSSSPTRSAAER